MSVKTNVIFIPHWIAESLKRAQMSPPECLDFRKIKHVVSTEDLLTFIAAQSIAESLTGVNYSPGPNALMSQWQESVKGGGQDEAKEIESLYQVSGAGYDAEVKARLFTPGTNGNVWNPDYEKPFIIYDLMPDVVGVVIHPGFFTEKTSKELQLSLIEAILKSLYVYNPPYHEVASTLWFKRFLQLLAPTGR